MFSCFSEFHANERFSDRSVTLGVPRYRKVVYESRGSRAIFQLLVRLLFKCGFYLRAAYMPAKSLSENPESLQTWPVKSGLENVK